MCGKKQLKRVIYYVIFFLFMAAAVFCSAFSGYWLAYNCKESISGAYERTVENFSNRLDSLEEYVLGET